MRLMERLALESGMDGVFLTAQKVNPPAFHFYSRLGYSLGPHSPGAVQPNAEHEHEHEARERVAHCFWEVHCPMGG